MLTKEVMQRCLPSRMKSRLDDETVERMNLAIFSEEAQEAIKENFLGFTSVLKHPNYSMDEYLNAVKYITYTMMGDTNVAAWAKVFPDRYQRLLAKGTPSKDINAHVRHYNRTKLVNEIREQSLVPSHILNADKFQEAINIQAALMADETVSPKVRSDAANSLLTHLKRPETQRIELDVGIKEDSMLQELKDITAGLAAKQQQLIQGGAYNAKDIAHQEILTVTEDGEVVDG